MKSQENAAKEGLRAAPPAHRRGEPTPKPTLPLRQITSAEAPCAPPARLAGRWGRIKAWLDALFIDHAIIALVYVNRHQIAPGVWRSAQPLPQHLRWFKRAGGKTVINLRGTRADGVYALEVETCRTLGLTLVNLRLRSRGSPKPEEIEAVRVALSSVERPILFHCKSGADRAGLMATLYLMLAEDRPVGEAAQQLSWRYGHIQRSPAGALDDFFRRYAAAEAETGISFADWMERIYDRHEAQRAFRASRASRGGWGRWLNDHLLRRE